MKMNLIPCIIALAASVLVALGLYDLCRTEDLVYMTAIFGGISLALTLGTAIGISFENGKTNLNVKILSGSMACVILISNIIFCCIPKFSATVYIITNGILLLIWLLLVYKIVTASKNGL